MSDTENTSMLQKIKDFFTGRKSGDITPADAEKIQKAFYALSKVENKKIPHVEGLFNGCLTWKYRA